jgi:hypothetical protein
VTAGWSQGASQPKSGEAPRIETGTPGSAALPSGELAAVLKMLGCPADKAAEMAAQLDKRARQLADQKHRSYEDALAHLLTLMRQGWAAQEKDHGV